MGSRFEGKVAVVSGAGRGIGRSIALLLAEEGASVVVNDLGCEADGTGSSPEPADRATEEIKSKGGTAVASYDDVTLMEGGESLITTALTTYGRVDVLVNSVAVLRDTPIDQMSPEEFDQVIRNNVKGTFVPTKYAAIQFRQQRSGRIVNMTSDAGLGVAGRSNYAAASEAIIGMTRSVARDMGRYGVTCNAISPVAKTRLFAGPVDESSLAAGPETALAGTSGLGRLPYRDHWEGRGTPDDPGNVAPVAVLLCTDAMQNVNGHVFGVRGGSIFLYSNPVVERSVHKWGAFTMGDMEYLAPGVIGPGPYREAGMPGRRKSVAARLEGRVAIVTGAGRGLGRSVAMLLAAEGASVVVNDFGTTVDGADSSMAPADTVVREISGAGGTAAPSYASVAEFESAGEIVETAMDSFGRLDILCNAAGILRDRMVFNMTEEEWDGVLGVHLYGAYNMVRNCVPHMMKQEYGRMVLFSSSSGLGVAGQANYASAKEGMVGFARSLAVELAPHGITINAVYPGANTRMMATVPESTRATLRAKEQASPGVATGPAEMVTSPEPEEALAPENNAPKIVYLCTEAGGAVTGQVIGTSGWAMSLYSPRRVIKGIHKSGRWTLDELDRLMPVSLAAGLVNPAPPEPSRKPNS